ncbi:MAG: DMT family transporter [Gemmatimonadales bacterium]|nr:MAG: DMT family transporter [Gemmatimonadales bacterium]
MRSEKPDRRVTVAYLQVLLAGTLWGTSGPFSVALYRVGIPPTSVAMIRPAAGLLFLFAFLAFRGRGAFRLGTRDALVLVGLGGIVVGLFQLAYQFSTESVGVPATVALLYLAPAWVVGMSAIFLGERITAVRGGLALLSIGGVWLTVFGAQGVDVDLTLRGILWGCVTGVSYGTYTLFGKITGRTRGALVPLFWSTVGGTMAVAAFVVVGGDPLVLPSDAPTWGLALLFGLLTMAAAPLLLFSALRTLEAGRASIGTTIEPLVAAVLAMLLLEQTLAPVGWLGLAVLMVGVAGAYAAGPSSGRGKSRTTSPPPSG